MSRSDQRRRRVLRAIAPVAGLLAAGLLVWQGSYAAFSAQTSNTANAWNSGSMTLTNDGGTGTYAASAPFATTGVFNETAIKPGDTRTRCLTVRSGGTTGGTLRLYRGTLSGTNNAALAPQISLAITASTVSSTDPGVSAACAGFPAGGTTVNTNLSALPTTYAAGITSQVLPTGTQYVAYRFVYSFATTGTNAGDNALQSSSAVADLNWELQ